MCKLNNNYYQLGLKECYVLALFSGKSKILGDLIQSQHLTADDIKLLFDHSDRYIVPYLQTYMKRYGLVLYNPADREGAESEANDMNECLNKAGFHTRIKQWKHTYELNEETCITRMQELAAEGLSLLVVCIMSHGTVGVLRDSGGAAMPITDILSNMRIGLPECLPLVRTPVLFENMLLI